MIGLWLIGLALLILAGLLVWGIRYTRKHQDAERTVRYRAAAFLFTLGFLLSAGYILTAKKMTSIDLNIAWMLLCAGLLFSSAVLLLIGFMAEQQTRDE